MSNSCIRKVLIVGGGTSGWMTAAFLSQALGEHITIELIESDEISTIGVGEATIPPINNFNSALGIDENEFVKATQATFKLGIEFRNWGGLGERYIHGFGSIGHVTGVVDFHHYWLKMFQAGKVDRIDDYSINLLVCEKNRFMRPRMSIRTPRSMTSDTRSTSMPACTPSTCVDTSSATVCVGRKAGSSACSRIRRAASSLR